MLRRISNSTILTVLLFATALGASAQSGEYLSFTPYSIFGVGDLVQQGSPYNRGMGGVGIATRNVRYLNNLNPASVTARDSLSVLMDFSVTNNNTIYRQNIDGNRYSSANNNTNIGSIGFSTPVFRNCAVMIGVTPYAAQGYSYLSKETDPTVIARNGNISYYDYGQGSMYKVYLGGGYAITKNLSVGAEADYIFGNYNKYFTEVFGTTGYNTAQDSYEMKLNAFTGKFGLQYEQRLGKEWTLGVGATYSLKSNFHGTVAYSHLSVGTVETITVSSKVDTLGNNAGGVQMAPELGIGISLSYLDKFRAEFNYIRSDWTKSGMDAADGFSNSGSRTPFKAGVRESYRAGVEYIPNMYDLRRRWKRYTYRAGAYYNNEYYKVAGNEINSFGITLGATIPVYQWYNGLTFSVDLGQRGRLEDTLIRERYIKVSVGVNLHDLWFLRYHYN